MTTEEVFAWIKTLSVRADNYYCGLLNSKKDKSFGVYPLKERRVRDTAIGGDVNKKTGTKGISILVHWNSSTRETEAIAMDLYGELAKAGTPTIGGKKANYIQLMHDEPIDVGTDENGVCEYVIEFVIYYERS